MRLKSRDGGLEIFSGLGVASPGAASPKVVAGLGGWLGDCVGETGGEVRADFDITQ